jgi:hypothetical protein
MVAKRRIPKKKLKEPDEFITWGSRFMNYILSHVRYIVLGILLLGVIILGFILWRQHMIASDERAFGLLGKGIHLYHQGRPSLSRKVLHAAKTVRLGRGRLQSFSKKIIGPLFANHCTQRSGKFLQSKGGISACHRAFSKGLILRRGVV